MFGISCLSDMFLCQVFFKEMFGISRFSDAVLSQAYPKEMFGISCLSDMFLSQIKKCGSDLVIASHFMSASMRPNLLSRSMPASANMLRCIAQYIKKSCGKRRHQKCEPRTRVALWDRDCREKRDGKKHSFPEIALKAGGGHIMLRDM